MCDLPGSGIRPPSPALAGGFFTTEPSGKPQVGITGNFIDFFILFSFPTFSAMNIFSSKQHINETKCKN